MTLLAPDNEHNTVFIDVPSIGFRIAKSLKGILVKTKIPQIKNESWCFPCKGPRCEIYNFIIPTWNLTSSSAKRTYEIRTENLNCR